MADEVGRDWHGARAKVPVPTLVGMGPIALAVTLSTLVNPALREMHSSGE